MQKLLLIAASTLAASPLAERPFQDLGFEEACAQAASQEKLVFIDFYTTWCGPCKKLDQVTWKDESVIAWLEENTVPLKIDAEKQVALAKRYSVDAYPSLLFVEASGDLKGRIVGFREPQAFLAEAADVLAGIKPSDRLRESLAEDANDPSLKKKLASALVREGEYPEALELYMWCFDHGDEDPMRGFGGVRTSFLLNEIVRLGRSYPPALEALRSRRDAARNLVLGPAPDRRSTVDLAAINRNLGDPRATLEVYDQLLVRARESEKEEAPTSDKSNGFDPRPQLFDEVVGELLEAKRYRDLLDGYGDPLEWFQGQLRDLDKYLEVLGEDETFLNFQRGAITKKTGVLYQALLGVGDQEEQADELATALVEFLPTVGTWRSLMKWAGNLERKDIQRSLREAALKALPEDQHRKIRKVRD